MQRCHTGHSAVKLSSSNLDAHQSPLPCRYVPQEARLERALGLSLVDHLPIRSPTTPPGRFLRCRKENTECALPDSQGQIASMALGPLITGYLLNEQVLELTSSWRLINHHIPKGAWGASACVINLLPTLSAPDAGTIAGPHLCPMQPDQSLAPSVSSAAAQASDSPASSRPKARSHQLPAAPSSNAPQPLLLTTFLPAAVPPSPRWPSSQMCCSSSLDSASSRSAACPARR